MITDLIPAVAVVDDKTVKIEHRKWSSSSCKRTSSVRSVISLPVTLLFSFLASVLGTYRLGALFLVFVFWTTLQFGLDSFVLCGLFNTDVSLTHLTTSCTPSYLLVFLLRILSCNVISFIVLRISISTVLILLLSRWRRSLWAWRRSYKLVPCFLWSYICSLKLYLLSILILLQLFWFGCPPHSLYFYCSTPILPDSWNSSLTWCIIRSPTTNLHRMCFFHRKLHIKSLCC